MINWMTEKLNGLLLGVFLRMAGLWYSVVVVYCRPDETRVRALHFAETERDLNISVRSLVEGLDENKPEERTTEE